MSRTETNLNFRVRVTQADSESLAVSSASALSHHGRPKASRDGSSTATVVFNALRPGPGIGASDVDSDVARDAAARAGDGFSGRG